ncbi:unnamed protein product [Mesocestoides corti]|uniref:Uncharacterized protein n=1 Tax=Mesocestoides corti TaxID=53468 RepID=A0A158QUT1_MESCO|nr:unnamed protein product [Mesocestoides corti]
MASSNTDVNATPDLPLALDSKRLEKQWGTVVEVKQVEAISPVDLGGGKDGEEYDPTPTLPLSSPLLAIELIPGGLMWLLFVSTWLDPVWRRSVVQHRGHGSLASLAKVLLEGTRKAKNARSGKRPRALDEFESLNGDAAADFPATPILAVVQWSDRPKTTQRIRLPYVSP